MNNNNNLLSSLKFLFTSYINTKIIVQIITKNNHNNNYNTSNYNKINNNDDNHNYTNHHNNGKINHHFLENIQQCLKIVNN